MREALLRHLTAVLGNDALAAQFTLLHLLSRVRFILSLKCVRSRREERDGQREMGRRLITLEIDSRMEWEIY